MNAPCFYCNTLLTENAEGFWVDHTDGDCCWGDDDNVNENESHVPDTDKASFSGSVHIYRHGEWRNIAHTYSMGDALTIVNHWRGRGYVVRLIERIVHQREIVV